MAVIGLSAAVQGYYIAPLTLFERAALLMTPFLLIVPNTSTDLLSLAILVGVYLLQRKKAALRKKGSPDAESINT